MRYASLMDIGSVTEQRFIRDVLENPKVRTILERWDDLGLPDGWLVAGCLFQTVWNVLSGLEAESRIKDYDLFYFEPADLSEAARRTPSNGGSSAFLATCRSRSKRRTRRVCTSGTRSISGTPIPRLRIRAKESIGSSFERPASGSGPRRTAWRCMHPTTCR